MQSIEPQVANVDFMRVTLGANQPEYEPLEAAIVIGKKGTDVVFNSRPVIVRFRLTDEEREMIANGADIYVGQLTFGHKYPPVNVTIVPDGSPLDCSEMEV